MVKEGLRQVVTHVVLFRLRDRSYESMQKARDVLLSMEDKIPFLRSLEVGIDALRTERSYDLALIARFDSFEDLEKYRDHPDHLEVLRYIRSVAESSVVVDYES